jgi:hypothetical protein
VGGLLASCCCGGGGAAGRRRYDYSAAPTSWDAWAAKSQAEAEVQAARAAAVSAFLAWIRSPCLRYCVHGASIGRGGASAGAGGECDPEGAGGGGRGQAAGAPTGRPAERCGSDHGSTSGCRCNARARDGRSLHSAGRRCLGPSRPRCSPVAGHTGSSPYTWGKHGRRRRRRHTRPEHRAAYSGRHAGVGGLLPAAGVTAAGGACALLPPSRRFRLAGEQRLVTSCVCVQAGKPPMHDVEGASGYLAASADPATLTPFSAASISANGTCR